VDIRYNLDVETELPHIYGHGVTEDEVEQILMRRGYDRPAGDNSRMALGQTRAGRYLKVVYVPDEDGKGVFIVTAHQMTGNLLTAYRRWARRRGR
jgi:hypothetical protein